MWASSSRSYAPPDRSYSAQAAPLWRRAAAAAVDWALAFVAYLVVSIPLGVVEALGRLFGEPWTTLVFVVTQAVALGVIVAYFTALVASGHTLGMRALDIHVRTHESGAPPGPVRSLGRGLLSLVFGAAVFTAYGFLEGRPAGAEGFTETEENLATIAVSVALASMLGHLWQLLDPDGRTVWDRLSGLVVVEDIVPAGMSARLSGPWAT